MPDIEAIKDDAIIRIEKIAPTATKIHTFFFILFAPYKNTILIAT